MHWAAVGTVGTVGLQQLRSNFLLVASMSGLTRYSPEVTNAALRLCHSLFGINWLFRIRDLIWVEATITVAQ